MQKNKIEIEVEKLDKGTMFLHTQLATGKIDKTKFTVDQVLPGGSLVINIGEWDEHQRYKVGMQAVVKAVLDFHFDGGGKEIKVADFKKIKDVKSQPKKIKK